MVGGFNTNVRYKGRVLHVQTEDSGAEHPHVITLLYEGGAILYSKKRDYDASAEGGSAMREVMEEQHRDMVTQLKGGGYDELLGLGEASTQRRGGHPGGAAHSVFGEQVITDKPLDEVIAAHLA